MVAEAAPTQFPFIGQETVDTETETDQRRERSSIGFPYSSLDEAIEVAKKVHEVGGNQCELAQLPPALGHENVKSGAFRVRLMAARMFGLIETSEDIVTLTPLGKKVLEPGTERSARASSFLHVPLYNRIYGEFKGYSLPKDTALENAIRGMGVVAKQVRRARQVFVRSAEQAGFFAHGKQKLVMPSGIAAVESAPMTKQAIPTAQEPPPVIHASPAIRDWNAPPESSAEQVSSLHPLIRGLLIELPEPYLDWPEDDQKNWIDTARQVFKMLYNRQKKANNVNDTTENA